MQSGFGQTEFGQVLRALVGLEAGEFGLDGGGDRHHLRALGGRPLPDLGHEGVVLRRGHGVLRHVRRVEDGLGRQKVQRAQDLPRLVVEIHGPHGHTRLELRLDGGRHLHGPAFDRVAALGLLLRPLVPRLDGLEVPQGQLRVDDLHVGDGVHLAVDVDHVVVPKAAHHVADGVHLADVGEELVAESLPLARPPHEPGDVHELDGGRDHALGAVQLHEGVEARIGHGDHAHVGVDGAKRVVRRLGAGARQGVEQGGLAHVGQPDDADGEGHGAGA